MTTSRLLSACLFLALATDAPSARPGAPVLDIKPRVVRLATDSTEWVTARVKVLNRGGSPCTITAIRPSCACGIATVLKNPVQPMDIAEIAIRINTSNMKDSVNSVEFIVDSDAENSPYVFKSEVRRHLPAIDSTAHTHR